jgi:inorganic triphosphatase YgiF
MNTHRSDVREVTPTIATGVELTFEVSVDFTIPDLSGAVAGAALGPPQNRLLEAIYLDTKDLTLVRFGITLRRRSGAPDAGWRLTLPQAAGERIEVRIPVGGSTYDSEMHAPATLAQRVGAYVKDAALQPVARIRTHRVVRPLLDADGNTLAEFVLDEIQATVLMHGAAMPNSTTWSELQVELVDGEPRLLDAIRRVLMASGARAARATSELERALGRHLGSVAAHARAAVTPRTPKRIDEFAVAAHLNGSAVYWHGRMDAVTALRESTLTPSSPHDARQSASR